ncbi:MAG: tetratricopeptide repeat protein [Bacteroidetes bacterium]|nr:tetratricopeptide repeat protein [Bacteroidota bacterium]
MPLQLCAIYVYPPKTGNWLPWEYYASLLVIISLVYALWKARHNKMILFCAGFFVVTIAINIQIIPSRLFIVTDRYGYMPYLGLFMIPAIWFSGLKEKQLFQYNKYLPYCIGFLVLFTVFSVFAVPSRNKVWSTDISFLTDIINKNPPVGYIYRAFGNRGLAYKKDGKFVEALDDFSQAIKLDLKDGRNYFNRGLVYLAMQNNGAALADFNEAVKLNPDQPALYNTRSQAKFLLNDFEGAESDSKKCLELDSTNVDALNTLANITFNRKEYLTCEVYLSRALKIQPGFSIGYKNRGLLYLQLNRTADACSDFIQGSNLGNLEAKQLQTQYCK